MIIEKLKDLFNETFNEIVEKIEKLPISGSNRQYFRISSSKRSVIGTFGQEDKENTAFIYFSEHFKKQGINVPKVFSQKLAEGIYLQEDLGDQSLFSFLQTENKNGGFSEKSLRVYKKVIKELVTLQTKGIKSIDFSVCYPRQAFDNQSIFWDLNYFKYHFLKLAGLPFDEELLELDFQRFSTFLLQADPDFFLFRDFQSRNIILVNNEPYFIDYQGGRKGALQYDLASLLYDAKAKIPENKRVELLNYYTEQLLLKKEIEPANFKKYFSAYALVRLLQALGAYGFRGFFERKSHFLESIPLALKNLEILVNSCEFLEQMPELKRVLSLLPTAEKLKNLQPKRLKVTVKSFSFLRGFPYDPSGNGGGHIFDCRFLDNPGRIKKYKKLCGKDQPVIQYLEGHKEVHIFMKHVFALCKNSVEKYIQRNFSNFSVSFGCTGGQHRSVYSAERTAKYLSENFNVDVELIHTEGF